MLRWRRSSRSSLQAELKKEEGFRSRAGSQWRKQQLPLDVSVATLEFSHEQRWATLTIFAPHSSGV